MSGGRRNIIFKHMTLDEKKGMLEDFQKRQASFLTDDLNLQELEQLVSDLIKIPNKSRAYFRNFVNNLAEELFANSVDLSGLPELKSTYANTKTEVETKDTVKAKLSFNDSLKQFINAIPNLSFLKNSFLIELYVDSGIGYSYLVLYDDNYFINPLQKAIEDKIRPVTFSKLSAADEVIKSISSSNLICLVLISPRINDFAPLEKIKSQLRSLIETFSSFNYITIKDLNASFANFYSKNSDVDQFMDEISFVTDRFLSNSDLDFEEERIIKKLFKLTNFPLLDYRMLKGGKSGAKVVEVTPKRKTADSSGQKYVVKISRDKAKLKKEAERFKIYVEDIEGLGKKYQMSYESTVNFEGIKYTYASTSKLSKSYSLSEIIDSVEHPFNFKAEQLIDGVFKELCFETWKREFRSDSFRIGDLYRDYLNAEKTYRTIALIDNLPLEEVRESEFVHQFEKLLNQSITTKVKVCHGDLHTGNFLVDEAEERYLIDFGFTDEAHAVIDHTTLECSIKFNHAPRYIKLEELIETEREFLNDDAFFPTFQIRSTKRDDLSRLYSMVNRIRSESLDCSFDQVSRIEYFISLLMITFRQISYPDLNQLFAWNSAKLLMKYIDENFKGS